ncbi:ATP-binding protein [Paraburkholderia heleia]|uniref:ATP-binding protein n=1 Tax=Paraburkholderia heleia TaxID=634127 RepID=UPI0005A756C3|nr:ATP-binding protein [Paraburkholderia heleia]
MSGWLRSIFVRNALALIVLVLVSQAFAFGVYLFFIQRPRVDDAAALTAVQIRTLTRLLSALPEDEREAQLKAINGVSQSEVPSADEGSETSINPLASYFASRLSAELGRDEQVRWEHDDERRVWARLHVHDQYYWIRVSGGPTASRYLPWTLICLLLGIATFPALGAFLIHRPVERLLRRLVRGADTIEQGAWPEAVPVEGPRELAVVADSFNRMAATLLDLEVTRAEMLAGISHDIRTPLTKLRMALFAPEAFEAPLASAERFFDQIEVIVQQFIDLARGWSTEPAKPGDLNGLIEQLAADYAGLGYSFTLSLDALPPVPFRPVGMQRLLMNLMQNAAAHGRVGLAIATSATNDAVTIDVKDRGPGVPDVMLPLIRRPFRRGAQNDQYGGTGLGLAIADRIAKQHDGSLDLFRNVPTGLVARVRLPGGRGP